MEKYNVEVDNEKVKQASEGNNPNKCPCGRELDSGGACPVHGTEPFEKRPKGPIFDPTIQSK